MKRKLFLKTSITAFILIVGSLFSQAFAFDTNANLALGKTAVARDARDFDGSGINPNYVTDGSMTSHWCALWDDAGMGSWIYVDLEGYYDINKVEIAWRGDRWPNGQWFLQVATQQPNAAGESNWVNVYEGDKGSDVTDGTGTYQFTAQTGRYVRMLGVAQSTGYGYNIYEFRVFANDVAEPEGDADMLVVEPSTKDVTVNQLFQLNSKLLAENGVPLDAEYTAIWGIEGSPAGVSISETGVFKSSQEGEYTVTCSTTYEETPFSATATITVIPFDSDVNLALYKTSSASHGDAAAGNDGSLSSRWRSDAGNQQEWWQVDLGLNYFVNNVIIKMNGDGGARDATYNILVSLTGEEDSWQTVVSNAQIPAGSGAELNSHTFAPTPARYVKYDGLTKGGWDHNFAEFEVHGTGFYNPDAVSVFSAVQFNNASVIEGEEVALTIIPLDDESNPYLGATITEVEVTVGDETGVSFDERDGVWYAVGLAEGVYTLTAIGVDDEDEENIHTKTATLTVLEARRVLTINISKVQDSPNVYATNRANPLNVSCVDQYGKAITPTLNWDIQGVTGSVTDNKFTPTSKGTATVKATSETSAGTVQSSTLNFEVITNLPNVAKNKPVTSIEGATGSENAVDESEATQWIVAAPEDTELREYDAWLVIDLGKQYEVELIEVIWEGAYSKTFTIDYSDDGVSYTTKYNDSNSGGTITKYNKFYTDPSSTRYVRVFSTEAGSQYGVKILDVYVHGKADNETSDRSIVDSELIKFFPNPTSDFINFSSTIQQATIYSLAGQEVMSVGNVNSMNISNLDKGIYIIKIVDVNAKSLFSKIEIR